MRRGDGRRYLTRAVMRESLLAMVSKPLPLIMLIALLAVSGLVLNVRAAVEHYHAQPYLAMQSDYSLAVELDGGRQELVGGVSATMIDYDVILDSGSHAVEVSIHGVHGLSDDVLANTQFNASVTGCTGVGSQSALIDCDLAKTLGVAVGDMVSISQRNGDAALTVEITGLYPTWGSANGLLLDDARMQGFAPASATYYCSGSAENVEEKLDAVAEVTAKEEFAEIARERARSILPGFLTDVMQWCSALLSLAGGLFFSAIVLRDIQKTLFFPLRCLGFRRREALGAFLASGIAVLAVCEALAASTSLLAFHVTYHVCFSAAAIFGTVLVGLVPAFVGLLLTELLMRDDHV